ncbi:hypothetical protein FNU76_23880 [Chitinimonas arctica]|uniref:Uncharacterized protein n=1 Tax=Chitinimonas arctica TaxID=2594795 RepID=A0A516SLX7_9NEIS|nr:hypothetical protein [Chitinimonas arctica]QDQ29145.1 hypothetical protein FNU76_23880 [Chitinimonas arctica]
MNKNITLIVIISANIMVTGIAHATNLVTNDSNKQEAATSESSAQVKEILIQFDKSMLDNNGKPNIAAQQEILNTVATRHGLTLTLDAILSGGLQLWSINKRIADGDADILAADIEKSNTSIVSATPNKKLTIDLPSPPKRIKQVP